jgi:hypothetical protein
MYSARRVNSVVFGIPGVIAGASVTGVGVAAAALSVPLVIASSCARGFHNLADKTQVYLRSQKPLIIDSDDSGGSWTSQGGEWSAGELDQIFINGEHKAFILREDFKMTSLDSGLPRQQLAVDHLVLNNKQDQIVFLHQIQTHGMLRWIKNSSLLLKV